MADEPNLPTEDDIRKLPRLARVAFASRCARRVLPLFRHFWPTAPDEYWRAVESAVQTTERSTDKSAAIASFLRDIGMAAGSSRGAAQQVAFAAHFAAAEGAATEQNAARGARAYAVHAATHVHAHRQSQLAIARDLSQIQDAVTQSGLTDETPVPPTVFGPMWADGVPDGWPDADPRERAVVTLAPPPGAKAEEIADVQSRLYDVMNRMVIANGGPGLTIEQFRRLVTT